MKPIRVATFAGPGASPQIREVPWPKVGRKFRAVQIGACGVCGTDLHILKGLGRSCCPGLSPSAAK